MVHLNASSLVCTLSMGKSTTDSTTQHRAADKAKFIAVLLERGTISAAAEAVGINRSTAYEWERNDPAFAAELEASREQVTNLLEQTAVEMALDGYEERREVLDSEGCPVSLKAHKKDPSMLRFLLGARRRDIYGDKREVAHSGEVTTKRIVFGKDEGAGE